MQADDCFGSIFRRQGRVIFELTRGASRHPLVSSKGEAVPGRGSMGGGSRNRCWRLRDAGMLAGAEMSDEELKTGIPGNLCEEDHPDRRTGEKIPTRELSGRWKADRESCLELLRSGRPCRHRGFFHRVIPDSIEIRGPDQEKPRRFLVCLWFQPDPAGRSSRIFVPSGYTRFFLKFAPGPFQAILRSCSLQHMPC